MTLEPGDIIPVTFRTLEITRPAGDIRITIPADWKITFGPVAPGSKVGGAMALRLWESETKQRACYVNVESFRDVSIVASVRAIRRYGTQDWYADDKRYSGKAAELVERAWVPEDQITPGSLYISREELLAAENATEPEDDGNVRIGWATAKYEPEPTTEIPF